MLDWVLFVDSDYFLGGGLLVEKNIVEQMVMVVQFIKH